MDTTGFIDTGAVEIGIEEVTGYGDGITGMGDG